MGKNQKTHDLRRQRLSRSLLAVSLAASLAAFGCTTNLNPGNGTPTRVGPELRTLPTSGITSGSETVTLPPMTSSYTRAEAVRPVTPRSIRRSAADAAAIMAGHQAVRGRYLGTVNPGATGRAYASDHVGGFVNPALLTNPQVTINSSISSGPTVAINSGAGGTGGGAAGVVVGGVTASGATAGAVIGGTGVAATTTSMAAGIPVGALAGSRPAVTESIAANPAVTTVSGTTLAPAGAVTTPTRAAATNTTVTAASTANATTTATSSGAVRLLRGSTGVTITNTGTARIP
jgi:hypothetical protein